MVYDQAQSPRLGQRTPVESTYVQMVDVDPRDPAHADLMEAAYPGQLIFLTSDSILLIWDEETTSWAEVAGGEAGQHVSVGSGPPTTDGITPGDTYYDQDNEYQAYVWDGDSWEKTAAGGISTYYETGFVPDPDYVPIPDPDWVPDPETDPPQTEADRPNLPPPPVLVPLGYRLATDTEWDALDPKPEVRPVVPTEQINSFVIGDIWFQTDQGDGAWNANYHKWRWALVADPTEEDPDATVLSWQDVEPSTEPLQKQIDENHAGVEYNLAYGQYLDMLASSTNNTADTADGRVSMSDYKPGPDDLTYWADDFEWNPDTLTTTPTKKLQYRTNGSIWFVRTRRRENLCTNPSFEIDLGDGAGGTHGWTADNAFIQRVQADHVPAGYWTLEVTNTTTEADHVLSWGAYPEAPEDRMSCDPNVKYTASIFAELVGGTGAGVYLEILWYDEDDAYISSDAGIPQDLQIEAWDPEKAGTIAEPRLWVTGTAPPNAHSFYVREVSPAENQADVWHTGALLVEQQDDLGRYFDGDEDRSHAYWTGPPHNSTSKMDGHLIQEIWDLRDGEWFQKFLVSDTIVSLPTSKLTGTIPGTMIEPGSLTLDKVAGPTCKASEALTKGDLVNIYNNAGTSNVRKANAATRYEAHGFVLDDVAIDAMAKIYISGHNPYVSSLAPGNQWLSTVAGASVGSAPNEIGTIVQRVGVAPEAGVLSFTPTLTIRIT